MKIFCLFHYRQAEAFAEKGQDVFRAQLAEPAVIKNETALSSCWM